MGPLRLLLPVPVALFLILRCSPEIVPTPGSGRLAPVFDQADLVCAGKVMGAHEISRQSVQVGSKFPVDTIAGAFVLAVDRCYKGSGETLTIAYITHQPPRLASDVTVSPGEDLLVLVKRAGDGTFAFVGPFFSKWDAELASLAPPSSNGLRQLENDLLLNIETVNGTDGLIKDLRILHALAKPSEGAVAAIRRFFTDPRPDIALEAFSIAIKLEKPADLGDFATYLEKNRKTLTAGQIVMHDFSSLDNVADAANREALERLADRCGNLQCAEGDVRPALLLLQWRY